mmetsp:Transcript_57425/g.85518  ORF Transcript_57425/g.85518 Transcript_57425/m.85518 type:complete len:117 (-) Transcript_57425:255-605(-)
MGSWKNQHLYDIVKMLDESADMMCYWAGEGRLWRITDCWMSYYDIHHWSNVACVNRARVPTLASKMETIFLRSLEDSKIWIKGGSSESDLELLRKKYSDHVLMSVDEEYLGMKYYK